MLSSTLFALLITITTFVMSDTSDALVSRYQNLLISIQNQRGLAPGDLKSIAVLRDEIRDWNATNDNFQLVAAELQMNIWLDDKDNCNPLFNKLTEMMPEDENIPLAWLDFKLRETDEAPEQIYVDFIAKFPNTPDIAIAWIKFLESTNRFSDGILEIEKLSTEELLSPSLIELHANLLYCNNRFDDAIASLESIDSATLEADTALATRVTTNKSLYETQAALFSAELAIQASEKINGDLPIATILTTKGPIKIVLFEDQAPNTVANFVSLAQSGYYDGTRFHRVIPKFMTQGGDPNSRIGAIGQPGTGGPGYTIKDELDGESIRKHFAGTLSMAKTAEPDTGGSQFFLTHVPTPHLDGRHTVFGRIIEGLEINRELEKDDTIVTIVISNARDHEYNPEKIGEANASTSSESNTKLNSGRKPTLNSNE
jgi:peptidyl-prolyl cis-trans isomerase B (cyclophilin B)